MATTTATTSTTIDSGQEPRPTAAHTRCRRQSGSSHVTLDPGVERPSGAQARDDTIFRLARTEPGPDRPPARHHDALVPQQLDARVILRIAARRRLERLGGTALVAVVAQRGDDLFELGARVGIIDRGAEALQ